MSDRLYQRVAEITAAKAKQGSLTDVQADALVVRDLRVTFNVVKTLDQNPNPATVVITNLSEASRAYLQAKPLRVDIQAGYVDRGVRLLFRGWIRYARSSRTPTGWDTTLQLGDGDRSIREGRVSRSFRAGTDVKKALLETASSMGLKVPKSAREAAALARQFASGVVLHGPAPRELSKVLAPAELDWSIQDGELQILAERGVRADRAIVVSQATGMIGVPEFGTPSEPGKPPVLSVTTLLDPAVLPGGKVAVQSRTITGNFKVRRVVHSGDTHGQDWTTTIEATPL